MNWREEYKALYRKALEEKSPTFAKDFPEMAATIPSDRTTNGLTALILKYLSWQGHYANRINTQGQQHVHKIPRYSLSTGKIEFTDKIRFTKSTTKKGTPDINAVINGRPVFIEVKAGKDTIKKKQDAQRDDILRAGGIHYYARNMQHFVDWYHSMFDTVPPERQKGSSWSDWY